MGMDLCLFLEKRGHDANDHCEGHEIVTDVIEVNDIGDFMQGRDSKLMAILTGDGRLAGEYEQMEGGYVPHLLSLETRTAHRGMRSVASKPIAYHIKDLIDHKWPEAVCGWWRNHVIDTLKSIPDPQNYRVVAWVLY